MEQILDDSTDPVLRRQEELENRTYIVWALNMVLPMIATVMMSYVKNGIPALKYTNPISFFILSFLGYAFVIMLVGWILGSIVALLYRTDPTYKYLKRFIVSICVLLLHLLNISSIVGLFILI